MRTWQSGEQQGDVKMAKYLSQEWHDKAKELAQTFPEKPGATAKMGLKVSGGPEGDIDYYQVIENGLVLEQSLGVLPDADFTMLSSWDDSVKIQKGELDANAAFMTGKMKVIGNVGKLMSLMPLTMSPEYKAIQTQIRDITEY
jgi:putative sterol carrier protein